MTQERDPVDLAAQALQQQIWASPPEVARLRSDVRSGESFLITPGGALPSLFVGAVVIEWGFDVPKDKADGFHQWLIENEKALADECPAGVHYRGTYGVFAQSDRDLGVYRTVWAFDSLATMELLGKAVAEASPFGLRLQGLTAFRDESQGAGRSQQIYHPAATAQRT